MTLQISPRRVGWKRCKIEFAAEGASGVQEKIQSPTAPSVSPAPRKQLQRVLPTTLPFHKFRVVKIR